MVAQLFVHWRITEEEQSVLLGGLQLDESRGVPAHRKQKNVPRHRGQNRWDSGLSCPELNVSMWKEAFSIEADTCNVSHANGNSHVCLRGYLSEWVCLSE